jgi:lipopolysaccharide biosynthesis glycosyltransferase
MFAQYQGVPVIVCATDRRYAVPLVAMLRSLVKHCRRYDRIEVYVIDGGLSRSLRTEIEQVVDGRRIEVKWIKPRDNEWKKMPLSGHIRSAAYLRILTPYLLPRSVRKAIYLDSDILLNADISDLWDIPMQGAPLLASQEGTTTVGSALGLMRYRELGLPPDAKYLNSGVLVMDVEMWRKEGITEKIFDYLQANHEYVIWHDQDGLNAILAQRWGELEKKWNWRVDCGQQVAPGQWDAYLGSLMNNASIIHFASFYKPWHRGIVHPSVSLFATELIGTPFEGWTTKPPKPMKFWNRHDYGKLIRKVPGIGRCWTYMRLRFGRKIK